VHKRFVIGANWKMNHTRSEARDYIVRLRHSVGDFNTDLVQAYVLPSFTVLGAVCQEMGDYPVEVGSQNIHWEESGAYTGEVSLTMVKEVGCTIAMIGHSERRLFFNETDQTVAKKVLAVYHHDLTPLICLGETGEEHKAGKTAEVLKRQIHLSLQGIPRDFLIRLLILYEPRWAIGAKEPAPLEYIQSAHALMRNIFSESYDPQAAAWIRLVYGGSVTLENMADILRLTDVDGCGVGRASWDPLTFAKMIRLTEEVAYSLRRGP